MFDKKIISAACCCAFSILFALPSHAANTQPINKFRYPFYVGFEGGYGSTTWGHLTPSDPNDPVMSLSTPTRATEGGSVWGLFAGYEFIPQFALEANYMHFQAARLYFDPYSLFTSDYGLTELTSQTETVSLMAKFMLIIPHTTIRAYSSIGAGAVHRYDEIKNIWRVNPSFGAGFNYNFTEHWMGEIGINYTAGYGEAEVDPTKDFVPFLYSVFVRVAYRF